MTADSPPPLPNDPAGLYVVAQANQHNITALRSIAAPPWVSSLQMRGTSDILWSCILTIGACVYTALHLNVPRKPGFWNQLLTKLKWVCSALLVPEVLLYLSATQFFEARWLQKQLKALIRQRNSDRQTEQGTKDETFLPQEVRSH